jgi:hypothetical protein
MFWYFTSSIIIGFIVYTLGTQTVKLSMFMVSFKVIAMALVIAALLPLPLLSAKRVTRTWDQS